MSKPVKQLIQKEYVSRLDGVDSVAVLDMTGIDANTNTSIRARLREKEIQIAVVRNSLVRKALSQVGLPGACDLIDGPCAIAYGADSVVTVVRELLDIKKKTKQLDVKGAVMEGNVFGKEDIDALSKYPTRDEAIADVVGCVLSAGANLGACLNGPGGQIAGILKALEEKQEEGSQD
jgi:ribosomal protein L10